MLIPTRLQCRRYVCPYEHTTRHTANAKPPSLGRKSFSCVVEMVLNLRNGFGIIRKEVCMSRIVELGSLRGLAALAVVIYHLMIVAPLFYSDTSQANMLLLNLWKYTPLHILWDGPGAVRLFFVLSGFVLALLYLNGNAPTYRQFMIKRVCRIYLPYVAALLFSILLDSTFSGRHTIASLGGSFFNEHWQQQVNAKMFVQYVILIDDFHHQAIIGIIWTLIHEMRISLIFPFLVFLALRWSGKRFFLVMFLISIVGYAGDDVANVWLHHDTNYYQTVSFLWLFAIGILLAQRRDRIIVWYQSLAHHQRAICAVLGVLCFTYRWLVPDVPLAHSNFVDDIGDAIGASYFIVVAIAAPCVQRVLRWRPCLALGDISFSLYLFHFPLILTGIWLFYGRVPLWIIMIACGLSAVVLAYFAHRLIEVPAQALGQRLAGRTKPVIAPAPI